LVQWIGIALCLLGGGALIFLRLSRIRKCASAAVKANALIWVVLLIGCTAHTDSEPSRNQTSGDAKRSSWREVDLGEVRAGEDLQASFEIRNTTNRSFRVIRIDRSCSCEVADAETDQSIPVGSSTRITVRARSQGNEGAVVKQIRVVTDSPDPEFASIVLTLWAMVIVPVKAVPTQIMFGQVKPGECPVRTIRLIANPPDLINDYAAVESSNDLVHVRLREWQRGSLLFDVELDSLCLPGDLSGEIMFYFKRPDLDLIRVSVLGHKRGPLKVTPDRLVIRDDSLLTKPKLRVSSTSQQTFRIVSVTAPCGVTVSWKKDDTRRLAYDLIVTITKIRDFRGTEITIHTDLDSCKSIRVPLFIDSAHVAAPLRTSQ
jgi:hypothetical protein